MRNEIRPLTACLSLVGMGGRIQGMRRGLYSLQAKASRLQLGVTRKPMNIDQAFQAQRLNLRK